MKQYHQWFRRTEETMVLQQTLQPKFPLLKGHFIQCLDYTGYKACFCLENNLTRNFYPDISQEKQQQKRSWCVWNYLFAGQADASASKSTCHTSLTTWVQLPEFMVRGELTLKAVLTSTHQGNDISALMLRNVHITQNENCTIMKFSSMSVCWGESPEPCGMLYKFCSSHTLSPIF